jgi:hypothetical protein
VLSSCFRKKLPDPYRELGDKYVRDEFKRHKTAKPAFLKQFFTEWNQYLRALQEQPLDHLGAELSAELQRSFNSDQKDQLLKLKDETTNAKVALNKDLGS